MPAVVIALEVGTIPVRALGVNLDRTSLAIANTHNTAIIYWAVQDPSVSAGSGFPIYPNGSIALVLKDGDETRMQIHIVSDTLATPVRIYESTVKR